MSIIDRLIVKRCTRAHRTLDPKGDRFIRNQAWAGLKDCLIEILTRGRVVGDYRINYMLSHEDDGSEVRS